MSAWDLGPVQPVPPDWPVERKGADQSGAEPARLILDLIKEWLGEYVTVVEDPSQSA